MNVILNKAELLSRAASARVLAYAPYSKFSVGAALLSKSGKIFTGVNVENVSYGLTMCAERVCVGAAIAAGEAAFEAIAIISDSSEPIVPCGACRQVLAEFAPKLVIYSGTAQGEESEFQLSDLLPRPTQGILR